MKVVTSTISSEPIDLRSQEEVVFIAKSSSDKTGLIGLLSLSALLGIRLYYNYKTKTTKVDDPVIHSQSAGAASVIDGLGKDSFRKVCLTSLKSKEVILELLNSGPISSAKSKEVILELLNSGPISSAKISEE